MLRLQPLAIADIPEVMRLERLPVCEGRVGDFSHEKHAVEMMSFDARYVGFRDGRALAGFALLQDFRQPVVRLRRIVVAEPGRGVGTALLRAVTAWVFESTPATGLRLHVRGDNARARHVYLREGFGDNSSDASGYRMSMARQHWLRLRADGGIARPEN
jgi:RimJ/RimL family protein N-acetyltransferase